MKNFQDLKLREEFTNGKNPTIWIKQTNEYASKKFGCSKIRLSPNIAVYPVNYLSGFYNINAIVNANTTPVKTGTWIMWASLNLKKGHKKRNMNKIAEILETINRL